MSDNIHYVKYGLYVQNVQLYVRTPIYLEMSGSKIDYDVIT